MKKSRLMFLLLSLTVFGCQSSFNSPEENTQEFISTEMSSDTQSAEYVQSQGKIKSSKDSNSNEIIAVEFTENFESGSKTSYSSGSVSLSSGSWYFADALLGKISSDAKNGQASARIRGNGYISMESNTPNGVGVVSLKHGKFGSDGTTTWVLQYSTDNGGTWLNAGSAVSTTSKTLKTVNFTVNQGQDVRIRIQKTDGSSNRVNIEDIVVNDFATIPPPTVTESENNDNRTSANAIGSVTTQTGLISVSTDVDYFSFPAINGQSIALALEVPAGVDYDLFLVDVNGSVLTSSELSSGLDESLSLTAPSSDTYYAVVQSYSGSSTMDIYTLNVSVTGQGNSGNQGSTVIFTEGFEGASKGSYATGTVTTSSGNWLFRDALIGSGSGDKKHNSKSARIRNSGTLEMQFDQATGVGQVTVYHASYGSNSSSNWQMEYSTNGGSSWTAAGSVYSTSSTLSAVTVDVNVSGSARIRIAKLSGGSNRINIDDIELSDYSSGDNGGGPVVDDPNPTGSVHLTFGNPSDALIDLGMEENYLLVKDQYVMSYSRSKATANWVSWHLDPSWIGSASRQNNFRSDNSLPSGWYQVGSSSYSGSGFNRGHMCPSADRTATTTDNSATFYMTNMIPQSPDNNQGPWARLEDYSRTLVNAGNELYIISGGYGVGGTGSNGSFNTINNGKIEVPAYTWKVIIVLPQGSNDVSRVTANTRVIAVSMPNIQGIRSVSWGTYRTTVDAIESSTGLDLLELIDDSIEPILESQVDQMVL